MKPIIASLAVAIILGGHAMVRKSFLSFAAPGQGPPDAMMNPPAGGPPGMFPGGEGKWWKNPELAQKLHLSNDQIQKLDKLAQDHQVQEIDLRADLEKQDAVLKSQMETDTPDEAKILSQIDKVTQARGSLEKSHVEMMLAARRVLTTEQTQMLRDLRSKASLAPPGFGPPNGGPEGSPGDGPGAHPPQGAPDFPPGGPPGPPEGGNAN